MTIVSQTRSHTKTCKFRVIFTIKKDILSPCHSLLDSWIFSPFSNSPFWITVYRSFSETESPTSLKTFRRRHNRQDHKENTRVKTSKRNCTLNVREDKTFLWRIDTQPPSYFFGTIHVPYTRVWDAVSDNAKKAFKVYIFTLSIFHSLDL